MKSLRIASAVLLLAVAACGTERITGTAVHHPGPPRPDGGGYLGGSGYTCSSSPCPPPDSTTH